MVENFGLYLRHERELRGVPLEEIAGATKIHIRFLQALENNHFDELPGEVFIKGYIRSYAKAIGSSAEDMINTYDDTVGKNRRADIEKTRASKNNSAMKKGRLLGYGMAAAALAGLIVAGNIMVDLIAGNEKEKPAPAGESSPSTPQQEPAATAEGAKNTQTAGEPVPEKTPEPSAGNKKEVKPKNDSDHGTTPPVAAKEKTAAPGAGKKNKKALTTAPEPKKKSPESTAQESARGPQTPKESVETEKISDPPKKEVIIQDVTKISGVTDSEPDPPQLVVKPLHLLIQVQGNSWFNLKVDGGSEEDFILPGGTQKSFYGNQKFLVTIGNKRGTYLFLNGQALDLPSGSSDVIRDFVITSQLLD
ncbi:MAG: RodZ domain-containing protein [Nitrospinaceae bacterium]